MPYLHEARLGDAIKRLYLLGSSSAKKDRTQLDGDLAAFSSTAGQLARNKAASQKLKSDQNFKAELRNAAGSGLDYSSVGKQEPIFIQQPSIMRQYDINHTAAPQMQSPNAPDLNTFREDPTHTAKMAMEHSKQNQLLEEMPINGVYTASGLRKTEKEATLNAEDRMRSRALIGQGMAMSVPYMQSPGPGPFMTQQQRGVSEEADREMEAYKFGLADGPSVRIP